MQAYGFSNPVILDALRAAKLAGIDVEIILDKSNERLAAEHTTEASNYRCLPEAAISNASIPIWIDDKPAIAHNKLIIIDGELVIGGSYNFTGSAEHRNAENVTLMRSAQLARVFLENWESRRAVSRRAIVSNECGLRGRGR